MKRSQRIPPGVRIEDLRVGTGRTAMAGCMVRIRAKGRLSRGQSIDRDAEKGDISTLKIGARTMIPGLERGIIGMRVGGLRRLRISPHLAYGASGIEARSIPPNAVITYEVELLDAK